MDKVKNPRGGWGFLSWGGVNFSNQRGVTPFNPKKISPAALITFDSTFFIIYLSVNDIVSSAQAKFFINGVIIAQNQAKIILESSLDKIIRITILKVLPTDKKGGGVLSPFQRGV